MSKPLPVDLTFRDEKFKSTGQPGDFVTFSSACSEYTTFKRQTFLWSTQQAYLEFALIRKLIYDHSAIFTGIACN